MKEIIAYCGLACHECGAYLATISDDDRKRSEVAKQWSKEYESSIRPEDIDCLGCLLPNERLFGYCRQCKIRSCAIALNVENCAHCDSFGCEKVAFILNAVPEAKARLDAIRASLGSTGR
jgi:hypothetical protein